VKRSIWNTLSSIDCSEHIEKKGQFSYLSWTWAWAMVKRHYPNADYDLLPDTVYPDGTMEVRVAVSIMDGEVDPTGGPFTLTHTMWLPVLDHKNKAITNPNAFDINSARMRCLVKCLAMHGLGHYIYGGESFPAPSPVLQEKYEELVSIVANELYWDLRKFTEDNSEHMDNLFNMAPEGKKSRFKEDVRRVYGLGNDELKKNLAILEDCAGNPDTQWNATEIMSELGPIEREFTQRGMNEILRKQIEEKMEKGE